MGDKIKGKISSEVNKNSKKVVENSTKKREVESSKNGKSVNSKNSQQKNNSKKVEVKSNKAKRVVSKEQKKENRKRLLRAFITLTCFVLSYFYGSKVSEIRHTKDREEQKNLFMIENSFLVREKNFYESEDYKRKYALLQKEMIGEHGGLYFNGKKMEEE